ncbi:hypothetical protein CLH62_07640 [Marinobacter guineae]|uniref:Uncharacterized protein n=2 Tax=Marinobacteraceae TaxID=2887365 RepID=A0A2G1VLP7_9GAMM|nr:hypothetical protein CLH62_07640 [Marinobacter guineae]
MRDIPYVARAEVLTEPAKLKVVRQTHENAKGGTIAMAKKRAKPTQESAIKRDLKTPKYQMRVVEDKTRYKRQRGKAVRAEDFRKAA